MATYTNLPIRLQNTNKKHSMKPKSVDFLLNTSSKIIISVGDESHDNQAIRWSGCNSDDKLFPPSKINPKGRRVQIRQQSSDKTLTFKSVERGSRSCVVCSYLKLQAGVALQRVKQLSYKMKGDKKMWQQGRAGATQCLYRRRWGPREADNMH